MKVNQFQMDLFYSYNLQLTQLIIFVTLFSDIFNTPRIWKKNKQCPWFTEIHHNHFWVISGTPKDIFPYHFPISFGILMGRVWVPLTRRGFPSGVANPTKNQQPFQVTTTTSTWPWRYGLAMQGSNACPSVKGVKAVPLERCQEAALEAILPRGGTGTCWWTGRGGRKGTTKIWLV